jgi:hypothetical protein
MTNSESVPTDVTPASNDPAVAVGEFLRQVLAWPGEDEPGYINLHWWQTGLDGKAKFVSGLPFRTVEDFLAEVERLKQQRLDIYMCMSRQEKTRTNNRGQIVAAKSKLGALALRTLWLEIDVKPGQTDTYATFQEAVVGLHKFIKSANMPPASALVQSGGGLHCYFFSDRALTVGEWMPYAAGLRALAEKHGLKFDKGVTTDPARVLRVPGTINYKYGMERPVRLLRL